MSPAVARDVVTSIAACFGWFMACEWLMSRWFKRRLKKLYEREIERAVARLDFDAVLWWSAKRDKEVKR